LRHIFIRTLEGNRVENAEVVGLCKDGSSAVFLVNVTARMDASGQAVGLVCFAQDISDRVQLEAELIEAESRERKRIGRDLHDGLGQEITGIQCLTRSLANRLEAEASPHTPAAQEIAELIRSAATRARELARGLNPFRIDARSFIPAIEELSNGCARTFGVPSTLRLACLASLKDDSVAEHLFRITQQAVTNAVQHGKPTHIDIRFAFNGQRGVLAIADNGCGISDTIIPGSGMGLRIMERRARIIGGTLEVRRRKVGGTKVICTFDIGVRTDGAISRDAKGSSNRVLE
jgi:signal transduction histidine kinase